MCSAVRGRTALANGCHTTNVNALRIRGEYERQGHISALVGRMERYAAENICTCLTIGVEARETRNLAIYPLGYNRFVISQVEEGELVLCYAKDIRASG